MDANPEVPIILGRPFLATVRAVMDVQAGTMSFWLCGKKIDFHLPPYPTPIPLVTNRSLVTPMQYVLPTTTLEGKVDNGDGGLHMCSIEITDDPPSISTSFDGTSGHLKKEVDTTAAPCASISPFP